MFPVPNAKVAMIKTNTMLAICEWTISSIREAESVEGFLESPNAYLAKLHIVSINL